MWNRNAEIRLMNTLLVFFCLAGTVTAAGFDLSQTEDLFPYREFETEIGFWEKVFTEYESNQVLLHDDRDLGLIYYVKEFSSGIEGNDREAVSYTHLTLPTN